MPEELDRAVPVALYYQVAQRLLREIGERKLRPDDFLTTEEEVQKRFGVSRATARRALQELVDDGVVSRIQGRGTYLTRPKIRAQLGTLLSFTEEIARLGMTPGSRVIRIGMEAPPRDAAESLGRSDVLRVERVRTADGEPIIHLVDFLAPWVPLSADEDFAGSLYGALERAGVAVEEAAHLIGAGPASDDQAARLGVPPGSPVLTIRGTAYAAGGRPILYEEAACRSDRFSYSVRLRRADSRSK